MTSARRDPTTFGFTDRAVEMRRRFHAPRSLVYDAMTVPEHVRVWFPADDVALHVCEIDLRVGGAYRYAWYAPGGQECAFRGTFLELERPGRIVCSWLFEGWPDDEAVETVTLSEDDGVTTVSDVLEFVSPEHLGDHFRQHDGAESSWDKLEDLLDALARDDDVASRAPDRD